MRVQTHRPGIDSLKAGFHAPTPGEYDYPDDPKFRGWLDGQIARGNVSLLTEPNPLALGLTAGSTPGGESPGATEPNPLAGGLTTGATPGEAPEPDPEPNPLALGPTPAAPVPAGAPRDAPRGRR